MIRRLLVANRGEIARRVFRTCRQMGIETVAIHSDPDTTEPHVLEADHAVNLPGSTPTETYLNIDGVLGAAKQSGADAIHPGYGFLAENAEFARRVIEEGLIWIGPPPESIEVMGSKLRSKTLVETAGVPTLGAIDLTENAEAGAAAEELGYPVLVKASAGGGGKGMRIVREPSSLTEAIEGARREAASSFGDDTIFLERYLQAARHIEIQVLGDGHGRVVSLFERECSIQRRHQKIIEEAPSPAIDESLRRRMGETAVAAATAVGYVGAGTVEFLFQDGDFHFLEMNTRLQVEHPVTEMITGLDLVRLQIEIANGAVIAIEPVISGHAIEARLYAEDPSHDFLPVTGMVHRFEVPDLPGLRVDSGVENGSMVSVFYDPMLAKIIAHGATRDRAAETLAHALRRAILHGPVTNRELLVRILEHDEFRSGALDTHFLERHDPAHLGQPLADMETERLSAVAAALADQELDRGRSRVLRSIPSGWRNPPGNYQERVYRGELATHVIRYSITPTPNVEGLGAIDVTECTPDRVELSHDGLDHTFSVARYGEIRHVDSERAPVRLDALPRFPSPEAVETPGSLHAPMPGRVVRVEARVGDSVRAGQVLVVLEAMKMEHTLRAPHDGILDEVDCSPGDQVEAGAVLVVIGQPSTTG
ncbi:MAG TPA: biotin carboxylase N-terminal domain-containing protein [Acidimicrobiia bacterium]|nr:biotin carboxylase N-terminal domain-containing protein [Acidimicrobiia bacterium]